MGKKIELSSVDECITTTTVVMKPLEVFSWRIMCDYKIIFLVSLRVHCTKCFTVLQNLCNVT